jgi:hypothetical protein
MGTVQGTWTPDNTVVTSGSDVIRYDPDDPSLSHPQVSWTISHRDFEPTWDVTVAVRDLASGSAVKTITTTAGRGSGSVQWDGSLDGGGQDSKGVYGYTVTAVHHGHTNCQGFDKVMSPAITVPATEQRHITAQLDVPSLMLTLTVPWDAAGAAEGCCIKVFSPKGLAQKAPHNIGSNGHLGGAASGTETFQLQLDPDEFGTFFAVTYATQTASDGATNRDQAPKPILHRGRGVTQWPLAYSFYDSTSSSADAAASWAVAHQSQCADGSSYASAKLDATAPTFMDLARKSALVMTVGHSSVDQVDVGSGEGSTVTVTDITGLGGLRDLRVLLALHLNCYAAGFAQAMVEQCGADCAIGWDEQEGSIPIFGVPVFSLTFWNELCQNGNSVGGAAFIAADEAAASAPSPSWYAYHIYGGLSGGACIYPARYGQ